jgi:hypothetical protein
MQPHDENIEVPLFGGMCRNACWEEVKSRVLGRRGAGVQKEGESMVELIGLLTAPGRIHNLRPLRLAL